MTPPTRGATGTPSRPRHLAALAVFGCLLLVPTGPAAAQEAEAPDAAAATGDSALVAALKSQRLPLALEGRRVTGPGAELILREAADARYLLVGETHGTAELPLLVGALFRELVDDGYRHLAVEIGPIQAERIDELLRRPEPMAAYRGFLAEHWPAVPFFSWRTEAELLRTSVAASPVAEDAVWGIDYDILADRYPLRRLREIAPDAAARAAADRTISVADSLLRAVTATGDPSRAMMFSRSDTVWRALRRAYRPEPGFEADRILAQLEATAWINEAWTSGRRWESNRRRVALIKENFLGYRRGADPDAKVMVKMGGAHLTRGRTPNNTFDLGNLVTELSVQEASSLATSNSFHVMALGGPGSEHAALDPKDWGVRHAPTMVSDSTSWAAPFGAAAFDDRWTLYDLRPLRPLADQGELGELAQRMEAMIFGYDAVVVLVGSTPADVIELER